MSRSPGPDHHIGSRNYLQLITVRGPGGGQFEGLDPFGWTNPYSVFGALMGLGYRFQSLALAALLPLFATRLRRRGAAAEAE